MDKDGKNIAHPAIATTVTLIDTMMLTKFAILKMIFGISESTVAMSCEQRVMIRDIGVVSSHLLHMLDDVDLDLR